MSDPNEIELEQEPAEDAAAQPEPDSGGNGQDAPAPDLEERLRLAEETAEERLQEMLRARAEVENARKRGYREIERARKYALERFMADMLEVRDSLERAHEAAEDETVTVEHLKEGTELTFRLLKKVLDKHGLQEIDPEGERFDPERHEAISVLPTDEHEPDTVVQVVQKGYVLNDRLIRAARVIVAAAPG